MDVRLGVSYSPKDLTVELDDDAEADQVRADLESAMAATDGVFWLTDRRGRVIGVPVAKLSFIEIGSPDSAHRIGFGS